MRGRSALLLCAALAAVGLACGSPGSSCPMDYPMSCPTPVPSYSGQVQAIFQTKCATCHAPGGQRSESPLTTWLQIQNRLSTVVSWTSDCRMPPVGAPPLTSDERMTMLDWFVCNAPNN